MLNENDGIFLQQNTGGYNAIMKTELIGEKIEEGLVGEISVGVDLGFDSDDTWPPPGGLPTGGWTFTRPPPPTLTTLTTGVPTTVMVPSTTVAPTLTTKVSTIKTRTRTKTTKPPKPTWWPWKPKDE